ncbi:MAG: arginase family protein [Aigarchaeota archaeon]|nr:arginase family protein [Aigarchaeota archaeon]MCX8192536.1 arginase family protein [Nitrososphaeria archaeon]MDW7985728.1 arginase family protein [Nitrososphaerota archaeon]
MIGLLQFYLKKRFTLFSVGEEYEKAEYIVFGVPFDSTVSFLPGCRFGPLAVRLFSENIVYPSLAGMHSKIADLGDLIPSINVKWMLKRTFKIVDKISSEGKKPIIIGGEHTLTLASLRAIAKHSDLTTIIFDAHLDLLDDHMDSRVNHATWLRRFLDKKRGKVVVIGCRDFLEEERKYGEENLDLIISADLVHRSLDEVLEELRGLLKNSENIYISVDVDVLDVGGRIGVSSPSPNGLTPSQVTRFLEVLCRKNIIGMDVVEVNPLIDMGASASYASYFIAYTLSSQKIDVGY